MTHFCDLYFVTSKFLIIEYKIGIDFVMVLTYVLSNFDNNI